MSTGVSGEYSGNGEYRGKCTWRVFDCCHY